MDNALLSQDKINKEIQQSQIYYSPQPRRSLSTQNVGTLNLSQIKNMNHSLISTANATLEINYKDKNGDKNPGLQVSITEKVVSEAILELSDAKRLHNSSIMQSSIVLNNSSFIQMNEHERNILRKNRILYQANGILIEQYNKREPFSIPIFPIKSRNTHYMLEIKDVYDGKRFNEEQEVFLVFDHLSNFYYNMKIYIVEKGSDDAILFSLDNAQFVFEGQEERSITFTNLQMKAFCLENIEKGQLNFFFLQKSQPLIDSDSSDSDNDQEEEDLYNEKNLPASSSSQRNNIRNSEVQNVPTKRSKKENQLKRRIQKFVKMARAYSFLGQPEMAINFYNRIFNNQNINQFNVKEVDALEELMFFLEEMEKAPEAVKNADRLLDIYGKLGNLEKLKSILFFKSNLSIKMGDFKTAEKDYLKLLEYLNLEDGEEMSYFASIAYGKLADIQFILTNNEKCLELLNDKYNTLIEIYKKQDLPQIDEIDDEEEYQQFERNNYETVQFDQEKNASTHISNRSNNNTTNNKRDEDAEDNEKYSTREERYKIIERNFLMLKEKEKNHQIDDEYDIEYLESDEKKITFQEYEHKKSNEPNLDIISENEEKYDEINSVVMSDGTSLQPGDAKRATESKLKESQQNKQSYQMKNTINSTSQKTNLVQVPNYNSCQQSMMQTEILRFDQKIVKELLNCSTQLADVYFQVEDIQFSINFYNKSIEFAEKLYGKESLQVAQIHENIGLVCLENMDFDESQEAFEKSLSIKEKVCSTDHPQIAISYSYLGCLHAKFHMYKQAKELYLKALAIFEHRYEDNMKELSETYNNLANIYLNEGDTQMAIQSYEKALELFIELKDEIPQLHFAQIYENLGIAHYQCGQFEKSSPYFEESVKVLINIYDERHPSLSRIQNWQKTNQERMDLKQYSNYSS